MAISSIGRQHAALPQAPTPALPAEAAEITQAGLFESAGSENTVAKKNGGHSADAYSGMLAEMVMAGRRLSRDEMFVLRSHNPKSYALAQEVDKARQSLLTQMQAEPAGATRKVQEALAGLETAAQDPQTRAALHNAINDAYREFASRYDQISFSGRRRSPWGW